ncbi:aminoglycoside phosphotransferase family protein [Kytococcus sedentarius]|uniref:aminoglycoside phosphotransferase family protein n=1 Tax=Kytococcus sedentarius TaxID=1276 RepID=UPI0019528EF4|nr:aminoglycoside phosphotransferase family protein [Kytococcus sedentarius]QRO88410.1 aminoglycoside phosphotransferase family protein [Kytococcus sedentarius]
MKPADDGPLGSLSPAQRALLEEWLPGARVAQDHSWGQVETTVLELQSSAGRFIVKAGGPSDHHIARELRAHASWLQPWVSTGHAPRLVHGDAEAKLLLTEYLPGRLIEGTAAQDDPDTYRQAGALLARFHGQTSAHDPTWNDQLRATVLKHLDGRHRIDPEIEAMVRAEVATWPSGGADVVPTHGDWQPRNWLIDGDVVRVIDFGRADLRPPVEDFARLMRQDFARNPELEAAFVAGYGHDPREPALMRRALLKEAVGTAAWAYGIGARRSSNWATGSSPA